MSMSLHWTPEGWKLTRSEQTDGPEPSDKAAPRRSKPVTNAPHIRYRELLVTSRQLRENRYLEGRSIAALAREHGVSRGAIRTAVADLMPDHTAIEKEVPAPELPVTLDMPGKVADFLRAAELEPAERAALDHGVTVRRGQG